jgi:hypothetical protein
MRKEQLGNGKKGQMGIVEEAEERTEGWNNNNKERGYK